MLMLSGKCEAGVCSLLETCLTSPSDPACTITDPSSVPTILNNLDRCMASIEDTACTASYGSPGGLVSGGGSSMVGWIQQLSRSDCCLSSVQLMMFRTASHPTVCLHRHGRPHLHRPGCSPIW